MNQNTSQLCCGDEWLTEELARRDIPQFTYLGKNISSKGIIINVMSIYCLNQKGFAPILIILGLVIFGGIVGGAYYLGTKQSSRLFSMQNTVPSATPLPDTPSPIPQLSLNPSPPVLPLPTTSPAISPSPKPKEISIPGDWKKYTVDDPDYKVRTSMSLPSGFIFELTYGWTFRIINSDISEEWEHSTSIYRANSPSQAVSQYKDEPVINHYDGSSRRVWYQKNKLDITGGKITKIEEHSVGNGETYLKLFVNFPDYSEGFKNQTHYLYVENGILHIIMPLGLAAYSDNAQLPKVMDKVFYSMKSIQLN